MGVCINYIGSLNTTDSIFDFIEEIEDICKIMEWKYSIIDEDWTKKSDVRFIKDPITNQMDIQGDVYLKGIIFTPPDCESMQFLFDIDGKMTDLFQKAFENSSNEYKPKYQWTKTQFAGVEVHIALIKLLKYIKSKYIANLEVKDEGEYWEYEDKQRLEKNMGIINAGIELITGIAENSQSLDIFLEKLDSWIKNKRD
jgi:hypothetical protein